jgi:16S rRNA (cytosine1402-N4)-methyltransferase
VNITSGITNESLDHLAIKPDGIYVDVTFGGGGHAREIANRLDDKGHLFVFDQDEDAVENLWEDDRMTLIDLQLQILTRWMKYTRCTESRWHPADLGVSSHQFDDPQEDSLTGFDESLDMRMNQSNHYCC